MLRRGRFAAALVLGLAGASCAGQAPAAEPGHSFVHEPGTEIRFHRDCADAEPYQVEAYAALRSTDGRARALARFYARRHAVRREEVFIGMTLMAMEVDVGPTCRSRCAWKRVPTVAGSSERSTADTARTPRPVSASSGRSAPTRSAGCPCSTLSNRPNPKGGTIGRANHAPVMEASGTELGLTQAERRVLFGLTLARRPGDDEMRLEGPTLHVPDRIGKATPPEPRAMGFLETINPLDEGSVWAWLTNSARYRHCVEERREAKRWFRSTAPQ